MFYFSASNPLPAITASSVECSLTLARSLELALSSALLCVGQGLCHHDFSPENVVITRMGDAAVVMDFGMVQRMPTDPHGGVILHQDPTRFGKFRYV